MEASREAATLRIYLLGRFAVDYKGVPIAPTEWKRRRPVDLLTHLALAPGHVLHREELIDRLWPDKDLDAGANNLYRTLHDLRRVTHEDVVRVERGAVRLHDSTWVDVGAFEEAVSSGSLERLQEAVELYQGDLLPDDPYSDHVQPRRVALRQRMIDAVLQLCRNGDVPSDKRIGFLRGMLEMDPTLEEGHRLLMTALAEAGRPKDAVAQFKLCVEALHKHLEATPSSSTQELLQRIKAGAVQPGSSEPVREDNWSHVAKRLLGTDRPRPIRGRASARQTLTRFAEGERGSFMLLGDAGAGKTRLAVECARMCAQHGAVILSGLGCEIEGAAPYTPFVDAWSDVLRVRPGASNPFLAFQPSAGGSPQDDRLRLFRAVEQSLVQIAGSGKACILIEDLHQADESSLNLFHHLVRASRHLPLQMIGTLREEEVRVGNPLHLLLASLNREHHAFRLVLERLDRAATAELLGDLWGETPTDESVDAVYGLAEGNPFYTEEVASVLREGGAFAPTSNLTHTLRARIGRVGPDGERLLLAASVQGVRFDFEVARLAGGLEPEVALDALDAALSARVVEENEHHYRFRHALMRQALCESLTRARSVYIHRATAAAFERQCAQVPCEPEVLSFHHQLAGNLEEALPYTLRAIENAKARVGFGEAVAQSERALELMRALGRGPDETMFEVTAAMGGMRVALGDLDAAVADLDRASNLRGPKWKPTGAQICTAKRLAALALIEGGALDEAEARLDTALEALGEDPDSRELCNVYYLYSQLRWHQSRHDQAFQLAEQCLEVAERAGDADAIAKGYEMLALACHSLGEWKKGRNYEEQRREVADGTLDVASAFDVHL